MCNYNFMSVCTPDNRVYEYVFNCVIFCNGRINFIPTVYYGEFNKSKFHSKNAWYAVKF